MYSGGATPTWAVPPGVGISPATHLPVLPDAAAAAGGAATPGFTSLPGQGPPPYNYAMAANPYGYSPMLYGASPGGVDFGAGPGVLGLAGSLSSGTGSSGLTGPSPGDSVVGAATGPFPAPMPTQLAAGGIPGVPSAELPSPFSGGTGPLVSPDALSAAAAGAHLEGAAYPTLEEWRQYEDDEGGAEETDEQKRSRKSRREKLRRDELKEWFADLNTLLGVSPAQTNKARTLTLAISGIKQLRSQVELLKHEIKRMADGQRSLETYIATLHSGMLGSATATAAPQPVGPMMPGAGAGVVPGVTALAAAPLDAAPVGAPQGSLPGTATGPPLQHSL